MNLYTIHFLSVFKFEFSFKYAIVLPHNQSNLIRQSKIIKGHFLLCLKKIILFDCKRPFKKFKNEKRPEQSIAIASLKIRLTVADEEKKHYFCEVLDKFGLCVKLGPVRHEHIPWPRGCKNIYQPYICLQCYDFCLLCCSKWQW